MNALTRDSLEARRVTVTLRFVAGMPPDEDGGFAALERIRRDLVATLREHTPLGIYDESFLILDWDDEPADLIPDTEGERWPEC